MFELVVFDDDDGQPEEDHVAADLGRGLRQPEPEERRRCGRRETGPASDGSGVGRGRPSRRPAVGRRDAVAVATGQRRDRRARRTRRAAAPARRRSSRTWRPHVWQRSPMSAPRRSTSQVSRRTGAARRRRTTSPRSSGEDGLCLASAGQGIKGADGRAPERASGSVAGSSMPVDRGDRHDDVRLRRRELGDDAARPGQRTGQLVRRADRRELEAVAQELALDRAPHPAARSRRRRSRPGRRRPRSPRRRRCAAR